MTRKAAVALDVGASTGGFTEVLLGRGAAKVYAVDVGRDQLHDSLRADPRVVSLEATDARALDAEAIPEPVGVIVADVSFISVTQALPAALKRAAPEAWLVVLVKPQFEAGREAVGKGGIVRDEQDRARSVDPGARVSRGEGWTVLGVVQSPIEGGSGNVEFLMGPVLIRAWRRRWRLRSTIGTPRRPGRRRGGRARRSALRAVCAARRAGPRRA